VSAFNHAFKQTLLDQLTAYQELLDELIGRLPRSSEESVYLTLESRSVLETIAELEAMDPLESARAVVTEHERQVQLDSPN